MKIDQIFQQIEAQKELESRFPVRLIFVENLDQYEDLVERLNKKCDSSINIADFCNSDDVYPNFPKLIEHLSQNRDKQIVLLSIGEFLRFRIKREIAAGDAKFPSLWQMQQHSSATGKVYVPMFACRDLFDRVVPQLDERQLDFLWDLDPISHEQTARTISVLAPGCKNAVLTSVVGIKNWLRDWPCEFKKANHCAITTALYKNLENSTGSVSVRVIDSPFDYVSNLVEDGYRLKREWATEEQWAELIPKVLKDKPFNQSIENVLNVKVLEPLSIMIQWDHLQPLQRRLVWIWYQLNNTDDYCGNVFRSARDINEIPKLFRDAIFQNPSQTEWIQERGQILGKLKNVVYDAEYFAKLDAQASLETRLNLLTFGSHQELVYAIKTASLWLKTGGAIEGITEILNDRYPLLEEYLKNDIQDNEGLKAYFSWYRFCKITNLIHEELSYSNSLNDYASRYSVLSQYQGLDCKALWVDGMGVEWLPLILKLLEMNSKNMSITHFVTSACLPTETKFNAQWNDLSFPYEKWDRLDTLAHEGMPDDKDYFSCIVNQLAIIKEVADKAIKMLDECDYVIITADHGTSRIAALSFHKNVGKTAPKNSIVKSFGRYCELHGKISDLDKLPCVERSKVGGAEYLVMKTHDHYSISGNAAGGNDEDNAICGEIHGGKTPEEYLVPVIILKRQHAVPLDYSISPTVVYRDRDTVNFEILFTREVSSLEISSAYNKSTCKKQSSMIWSVTFKDLELGEHIIEVIANGHMLNKKDVILVKSRGVIKNDDPFGDL